MNWDGMTWIHVKHRVLNGLNHLIAPGSVKCKLKMRDHDSEITPEAAKEIKHSEKGGNKPDKPDKLFKTL